MRLKNKVFSWLLLFSMFVSMLPQVSLPVFAADETGTEKGSFVHEQVMSTLSNGDDNNTTVTLNKAYYEYERSNDFYFKDVSVSCQKAGQENSIKTLKVEIHNAGKYDLSKVEAPTIEYDNKYGAKTAFWIFETAKTSTEIEDFIKKITFIYASGMNVKVTVDGNDGFSDGMEAKVLNKDLIPYEHSDGTIHYYMFVRKKLAWSAAYNEAKSYKYLGRSGYLATVNDDEEMATILKAGYSSHTGRAGWLGATFLLKDDGNKISDAAIDRTKKLTYPGTMTSMTPAEANSKMYWATGPEAGSDVTWANGTVSNSSNKVSSTGNVYDTTASPSGSSQYYSCMVPSRTGVWSTAIESNYKAGSGLGEFAGYYIEFGGYEKVQDPGGYTPDLVGSDLVKVSARTNDNDELLYGYLLTVKDFTDGNVVSGATVNVTDQHGDPVTVTTDANGIAKLWLPAGEHTLVSDDIKSADGKVIPNEYPVILKVNQHNRNNSIAWIGTPDTKPTVILGEKTDDTTVENMASFENPKVTSTKPITNMIVKVDQGTFNSEEAPTMWFDENRVAVWLFDSGKSATEIESILKGIKFNNSVDMKVTVEINTSSNGMTAAEAADKLKYNPKTGHFYIHVKEVLSWSAAYNKAKTMFFGGRQGYLATVSDADEAAFLSGVRVAASSNRIGWVGGSFNLQNDNWSIVDANQIDRSKKLKDPESIASITPDDAKKLVYWNAGPEAGETVSIDVEVYPNGNKVQKYQASDLYDTTASPEGTYFYFGSLVLMTNNTLRTLAEANLKPSNTTYVNPGYFVEFGGYDENLEPGGRHASNTATTTEDVLRRRDQYGNLLFGFKATVIERFSGDLVPEADINLKVKGQIGDEYVYTTKTGADGTVKMWLPVGDYEPQGTEIQKSGVGTLNGELDAKFTITADKDDAEKKFYIGINRIGFEITVRDFETGNVVEGATIDVSNLDGKPTTAVTDANGKAIVNLPEGNHTLSGNMVKWKDKVIPDNYSINVTVDRNDVCKAVVWIGTPGQPVVKWNEAADHPTKDHVKTFPNVQVDSSYNITNMRVTSKQGTFDVTSNVTPKWTKADSAANTQTSIWVFDGGKTADEVKVILASLEFRYKEDMEVEVEIDTNEVSSNLGSQTLYYNTDNGHYYMFISEKLAWTNAFNKSKEFVFGGRRGYLATVSDKNEANFILTTGSSTHVSRAGWLGGTYLLQNDGTKIFDSVIDRTKRLTYPEGSTTVTAANAKMYWADGPEAGKQVAWADGTVHATGEKVSSTGDTYDTTASPSGTQYYSCMVLAKTAVWSSAIEGNFKVGTSGFAGYYVEFGGYAENQDPGGKHITRMATNTATIGVRKNQNGDRLYKTEITVRDLQKYNDDPTALGNGAVVAGAKLNIGPNDWKNENEDKRLRAEPSQYTADDNGKVIAWLPAGEHTFKGDYATNADATKKIPNGMEQTVTVKADDYNRLVIWIGDAINSKLDMGEEVYDAAIPGVFTYENARLDSNVNVYTMELLIENVGKLYDLDAVKASADDAVITATDTTATWFWKTPKSPVEVQTIIQNLKFYLDPAQKDAMMKISIEVNGNATIIPWASNIYTSYETKDHNYMQVTNPNTDKTWTASYTEAKKAIWKGRQGYLANITSADEQTLLNSKFAMVKTWIGGLSLLDKNTGNKLINRDSISSTDWIGINWATDQKDRLNQLYWASGPERGEAPPAEIFVKSEGVKNEANGVMGTFLSNGSWVRSESNTTGSRFLVEFGGYTDGSDLGGYLVQRETTAVVEVGVRRDRNGTQIYKYTAKVFNVKTQQPVEGAVLNIKVPSPDDDPSKAYVYMGELGGVTTDSNGEAILWLPAGTYTTTGDDVYKDGVGKLNAQIDSTFEVKSDDAGVLNFWLGESDIDVKWNSKNRDVDGKIYFPKATVTTTGEKISLLIVSIDQGKFDAKAFGATLTDVTKQTGTWVFGEGKTGEEVQELLRTLKFDYAENMNIYVEVDTNQTTNNFDQEGIYLTRNADNGHYYMYIPKLVAWSTAHNEAKDYIYGGRKGYLATITSDSEMTMTRGIYESTQGRAFVGVSAMRLSDGSNISDELIDRSKRLTYPSEITAASIKYTMSDLKKNDLVYYTEGPEAGQPFDNVKTATEILKGSWKLHDTTASPSGSTWQVVGRLGISGAIPSNHVGFVPEANYHLSNPDRVMGYVVEFGGYRNGQDPGGRLLVKTANDTATIGALDAYYTYQALDVNGNEIDRRATDAVGYKLGLTDMYKSKLIANNGAGTDYEAWTADSALVAPAPESDANGNGGCYTYDGKLLPIISTAGMFAETDLVDGQAPNGFNSFTKLDLSEYDLPQLDTNLMTDMFKNTGDKTTKDLPALGLSNNGTMAAKFNAAETGIDKTKLYFGNVIRVEYNNSKAENLYDGNPFEYSLTKAKYTLLGKGKGTEIFPETFTEDQQKIDLEQVFTDAEKQDKENRKLRTTVKIIKVEKIGVSWSYKKIAEDGTVTFPEAQVTKANMTEKTIQAMTVYVKFPESANVADNDVKNYFDAKANGANLTDLYGNTGIWLWGETNAKSAAEVQEYIRTQLEFHNLPVGTELFIEISENITNEAFMNEINDPNSYITYDNGHYIMVKSSEPDDVSISWTKAYNKAKEYIFNGQMGYLATPTTQAELATIFKVSADSQKNMWIGATSMLVKKNNGEYAKIQDEKLNVSLGHSLYKEPDGYSGTAEFYYWACGPQAYKDGANAGILDADLWNSGEPNGYATSNIQDRTNQIGENNSQRENCAITDLRSSTPKMNDYPEGAWGSSYVPMYVVQFGGYDEFMEPGGLMKNKTASDTAIVGTHDAYYTYRALDANGNEVDRHSDNAVGYKLGLTDVYRANITANSGAGNDYKDWTAGAALLAPAPESDVNGNGGCYTYDGTLLPIISTAGMFAEDSADGQTPNGFNRFTKLDLSEYDLPQLDSSLMADTFKNVGMMDANGYPAIGLAKDAEAALFNDDTKTGINKANLYFGNITKVEGETQPVYRYGAEATSIDLDTAGIESYTITGSGTTVTLTEAELTSDPYTFDLTQVFSDDDKANATATSLRTTVTIVKVMAQQNIGVEAYFNADMATANPSAAIMRGAWATESDGYVDFYVRDEGNADGKISVENLKKLKVTADLSYGFENVAAFQTGDKADWYKNILESDLAMYVVKGGTETDIATLSSANNPTPVMFAPAVNNSVSETEEKTEVKDTTADNTENEAGSTTDETISDDNAENAESADTADTDENAADEPKAEEATEPNAEEKTENADVSTLSSEDDIALMALTYLDDAEIVTFTDALGNEQKYTKVRVKVSNVLASGIVTFKLSYNTGTDADSGETVYTAINNAEFDVIVPGDVDKDGVIGSLDSEVCTKVSNGAESAEKGRAGQYKFELADVDKDKIIGSLDAETCIRISNGAYQIRK